MKPKENWIYTYYQGIKDGTYCVGKFVVMVYALIIKLIEDKVVFFDVKEADAAIEWIETHCFHVEGPLAPGPIILEVWEKAFVSCIFGILIPGTPYPYVP